MSSLLLPLAGFIFGLKHAFEADHLLTVTTLISRTRFFKIATFLSLLWGVGHTLVLLLAGALVLAFKLNIPERLAASFELVVGFVLIVLGFQTLFARKTHIHTHGHAGIVHAHYHEHDGFDSEHAHKHKPLLLGMLHGLAGSAGLTILVLTSVKSFSLGMFYILVFGAGSIIGMLVASSLISLPFLFLKKESSFGKILNLAVGASGLALGAFISYKAFMML